MTSLTKTKTRSALLNYFSLFTSVGTLFCCALPSLLVLFGLGAPVASMLTFLPWLVTLSHYKRWTFTGSGLLLAFALLNMYLVAPRLKTEACEPGETGCGETSRLSKAILWVSLAIYGVGCFVAYVLGPLLSRFDR
jgi:hypothetical protein